MQAVKLSKEIKAKAESLGVAEIILRFSGGSDEGYLDVETFTNPAYRELSLPQKLSVDSFEEEVENWAWDVYSYSGAGCGSDYGDDITYDLKDKTITTVGWGMEMTFEIPYVEKLS